MSEREGRIIARRSTNATDVRTSAGLRRRGIGESATERLKQTGDPRVADPSAYCANSNTNCGGEPGLANAVGCPGFRPDARRILLHATDAGNQAPASCGGVATPNVAGATLAAHGIKYVGLYGSDDSGGAPCSSAQSCSSQIATASGTVDINGNPLAYSAPNASVVAAARQAALDVVTGIPMRVRLDATEEPGDDGDALGLLDYVEVNVSGTGACTNVADVEDSDADGHDETFPALLPGTPVCWDVPPVAVNATIPATNEARAFKLSLVVNGDGMPLHSRVVYFVVPPG